MQATVRTSGLFPARVEVLVPERMARMEAAIRARDFPTFAHVTMCESNSFHATCLDTDPPIFYLNDVSRAAIQAVQAINEKAGRLVAAYTFDAGPNAVVYYEQGEQKTVLGGFRSAVGGKEGWHIAQAGSGGGVEGTMTTTPGHEKTTNETSSSAVKSTPSSSELDPPPPEQRTEDETLPAYMTILRNGIKRVIHTSVGDGPVSVQEHLIDERGYPITTT